MLKSQPLHIVRKQAEKFFNSIFACTVARHYQDQQFCQVWDQFNKRNKIYRQKRDFDKSKVFGGGWRAILWSAREFKCHCFGDTSSSLLLLKLHIDIHKVLNCIFVNFYVSSIPTWVGRAGQTWGSLPPRLGVKPEYWFRGQTIKDAFHG